MADRNASELIDWNQMAKQKGFESNFIEDWEDWDQLDMAVYVFYDAKPVRKLLEMLPIHFLKENGNIECIEIDLSTQKIKVPYLYKNGNDWLEVESKTFVHSFNIDF